MGFLVKGMGANDERVGNEKENFGVLLQLFQAELRHPGRDTQICRHQQYQQQYQQWPLWASRRRQTHTIPVFDSSNLRHQRDQKKETEKRDCFRELARKEPPSDSRWSQTVVMTGNYCYLCRPSAINGQWNQPILRMARSNYISIMGDCYWEMRDELELFTCDGQCQSIIYPLLQCTLFIVTLLVIIIVEISESLLVWPLTIREHDSLVWYNCV